MILARGPVIFYFDTGGSGYQYQWYYGCNAFRFETCHRLLFFAYEGLFKEVVLKNALCMDNRFWAIERLLCYASVKRKKFYRLVFRQADVLLFFATNFSRIHML